MYSNKQNKNVEIYNEKDEKPVKEIVDQRLIFINECDRKQFKNSDKGPK
jgi:hypothetical protein